MNPQTAKKNLKVQAIGMDERKSAVFRMAFKMYSKRQFTLLEKGDTAPADLAVADLDSPDALAQVQAFAQAHPAVPILCTSVEPSSTQPWPVLRKPIRMETLFPALESLLSPSATTETRQPQPAPAPDSAAVALGGSTPPAPAETVPQRSTAVGPKATHTQTPQDIAANEVAPKRSPPPVVTLLPESVRSFDPESGLLGLLARVRRDKIPATITHGRDRLIFILDPEADRVRTELTDAEIETLCREDEALQLRAFKVEDRLNPDRERELTLQALTWQVAAWSAQGRLSHNIPLNGVVQLRQWPNLTRLRPLPESLRLSAFFARSPASPILTVKILQVQPADLFNFLAAADSLGLLRYGKESTANTSDKRADDDHASREESAKATPRRGFLGRILAKIAGL
ncbi:MAG: hypothetical protein ACP5M3_06830 [Acidithiobacillus sp.]